MKTKILFFMLLMIISGMSVYGQTYNMSSIAYSWNTTTTTVSSNSYDDQVFSLPINFSFDFFGTQYTTCYVSTNGLMTFGTSSTTWTNACIANTATPNNYIAAFWDDLYLDPSCSGNSWRYGTTGTAPNRIFTVSWNNFRSQSGACGTYVTTQIRLYETTNIIEVYLNTNTIGATGTIGIENSAGTLGYQAICNSATTNGTAWRWTPPPATPGTPTSNSPNCNNVTITRNGTPPAGETWYWQTSAMGTSTANSGATYTVTSSGTYYIRSYRSSDVTWGAATSIAVVVNNSPTGVSAGSDVTICSGISTQLNGSATAPTGTMPAGYCSSYSTNQDETITGISLNGASQTSGWSTYSDYTLSSFTTLTANTTYALSVSWTSGGAYTEYVRAFFDWDRDGIFETSYLIGSGSSSSTTWSSNITVPANAAGGETRMRIAIKFGADVSSCETGFSYGEVEDYRINVIPTLSYSWTPTTGLNNSAIANPIATPTSSTTYTMTATTNGCGVSDNVVVNVNSLSSSPTSVSSTSNPVCFGTSTTLSPSGGSLGTGASAVWYTGTDGGFTQDWVTNPYGSGGTTASVNAGILNVISTNGDPMIFMGGLGSYDPNIYRYVTIKYQITGGTGDNWEIFFYNTNHGGAVGSEEVAGSLISDGAWYTSTIDMWTDLEYRTGGNITGWRFDWAGNAGVTMNIDYITLTASAPLTSTTVAPTTNTTYFVRYEGQCNTSSSASTSITVSTPLTTGLVSTDYVWSGNVSTNWNSATNWLTYNGSAFTVAGVVPTSANNVFIRSYGSCASTNVATINSATANVKNLTIESGKTLTMASGQTLNVAGNWTNAGTFNAGNGTVNFNGSSIQAVAAGGSPFYNVIFNNSDIGDTDINLSQATTINGNATFTNGIVSYLGIGSLTFGATATATISSNNSFVDGAVSKTGSTAFTFPVGDVVSRDIGAGNQMYKVLGAITLAPSASTTVTVDYYFDNLGMPDWWEHGGNMDNTLHHVSDREQWVVNSPVNVSATSLYWYGNGHTVGNPCLHGFDDGNASEFVASDLSVAYWDGSMWVNAGGTVSGTHDAGNISTGIAIPFGAKSSKIITFGSKNNLNPLPVELIFFEGTCENEQVILSWETATETNNDYFMVERSSNLLDWDSIEKVLGAGNSNQLIDYSISTKSNGAIYYRLTQVDYDGKYEIFPIITVTCNDDIVPFTLYPNPTEDEIFFSEKVSYQVFSPEGKLVLEGAGNSISLGAFSPGMYAIKINNHLYKVIKQ